VQRLAGVGVQAGELDALLGDVDLRLVLTAHPTPRPAGAPRWRSSVASSPSCATSTSAMGPPGAMAVARRRLLGTVQELWGSDELRAVSPTVEDEVRSGLVYFLSTLASVLPEIYRDLEEAIASAYPGEQVRVPPFLTFGSWIGGDRDGNPFVTPDVTLAALDLMRQQCLGLYERRLTLLAERISLLGPDRRARSRARASAGHRGGAVPRDRRGGAAAQTRRSPTGARSRSCASACAPPPRAPGRATPTRAS